MNKTKLTDTEKLILERIKSYFNDQITLSRYESQIRNFDDNSNSIAQYGAEFIKVNKISSKVESYILKKESIIEKKLELEKNILELENAMNKLKKGQKIVVDELLRGSKMTIISQKMGKSKQQVYKLRKNALKNMEIFLSL